MSVARIERIDEIREAGLIGWRALPPGLCNRSFLVDTRRGRWVLRLNGSPPGVDREVEARVLSAVADAGLGAPLIACDPCRGYLLTEYLGDRHWRGEDLQRPRRQFELARRLRQLHGLQVAVPPLDAEALVRGYLGRAGLAASAPLAIASERLLAELREAGDFDRHDALCHHDLHAGNIIGHNPIRFVDWEFSRRGHPALDLGFVIQYQDLPADESAALVAAYYGSQARELRVEVARAVRLAQLLELLWLAERDRRRALPPAARTRLRRLLLVWA